MSEERADKFHFGDFSLDAAERILMHDGCQVAITPKVYCLLRVLIENAPKVVEKETLMSTVWADSFVEESNLTFTMRQLRKALGDTVKDPKYIETVPKRGYRFICRVMVDGHDGAYETELPFSSDRRISRRPWSKRPASIAAMASLAFLVAAGAILFFFLPVAAIPSDAFRLNEYSYEVITRSDRDIAGRLRYCLHLRPFGKAKRMAFGQEWPKHVPAYSRRSGA